ncbi:replication initiator protein A [Marinococcus halophilus]|uniref:replication initiator protein A n=1 Tax=Marinococcus halophilus TaxID=1371 RepID=UPI0009A6D0D3|nr:replication initiator protein A [Marinococcus halophilus]
MSNYYNIYEEFRLKHVQIPKVFFTNKEYSSMRNDSKIAWAILADRFNLSIKNNWFDDDGNIYFIYTNEDLARILNMSKRSIVTIKKELIENDLLEQVKVGQNKPNKLYIKKPVVEKEDVYEIQKQESDIGSEPSNDKEVQNLHPQGSANFASPEVQNLHPSNTEVNNTEVNNTDIVNKNVDNISFNYPKTPQIENEYIQEGLSPEVIQRVKEEIANKQEQVRHYEAYLRTCLDNTLHKHRLKRDMIDQPYPHLPDDHPLNYNWLQHES